MLNLLFYVHAGIFGTPSVRVCEEPHRRLASAEGLIRSVRLLLLVQWDGGAVAGRPEWK